jgi:hypothetical protein
MGSMTSSTINANDAARALEEGGKWKALVDSAVMSEKQRLEFQAGLGEPRPLTAMTVVAVAVSAGAGAVGLSVTLANFVEAWFWPASSPSTAMHSGAAFAVCCGAGLAGSVWACLFFRRAMRQ